MVFFRNFGTALLISLSTFNAAEACEPTHNIVRGDTLWEIAHDEMGSGWNYPQIFDVNRDIISDPNRIYVGDVLDIPCKTGALGEIDWSVMPTAEAFALIKNAVDVQIIDIRSAEAIKGGTIPGAVWLPYEAWRGGEDNPGAPRDVVHYENLIGSAGLKLDAPTLIVHEEDTPLSTGAGAYVYWVLKSLGGQELAILRGGFEAWDEFGGTIAAKPVTQAAYVANLTFSPEWRALDIDVLNVATDKKPGLLLDARPHSMYNRLDNLGQALATTIPGARNLPAPPLMSALAAEFDIEDGVSTVIDYYATKGAIGHEGDVITFCKSGQLSALNWFYASELASIENVRLYPESLIGWKQSFGVLGPGEG